MFGELFLTQQHPWNSSPALERPSWGLQGPGDTVESWFLSPAVILHVSTLTGAQATAALPSARRQGEDTRKTCWGMKEWECPDAPRLSEAFLIEKITCLYSKETFEAGKKNQSFRYSIFFSLSKAWQQAHVCMSLFVYICVCVCIYIHVCVCMYKYMCIYRHKSINVYFPYF